MFDERDLWLVVLDWEGDQELWSLEYEKMICMADDSTLSGGWVESAANIVVDREMENQVNNYHGFTEKIGPPSHIEVLQFIKAHDLVPREGLGRGYADLSWHVGDITGMTKLNDEQAAEWLLDYQNKIRDRLCELGNEVIEAFLQMDGVEISYGDGDVE